MRKVLIALAALSLVSAAGAKDAYVKPYFKADGTFVEGHYKTAPNSTKLDNYSTQGNYNPYTGKAGTVDPYKVTAPSNPYAVPAPAAPKPSTCIRDIYTGKCL